MMGKLLTVLRKLVFGKVIMKKVVGKFVKHATGALIALFASNPILAEAGINIDFAKFEAWLAVVVAGLFGAAFNFLEHRLK